MVFTEFTFKMDFSPLDRSLVSPMIKNEARLTQKIIDDAGELFLKLVQFYAPRHTGRYANSWRILESTKNSVTIGTGLKDLFVVLEFGVEHEVKITAKGDGVLHWTDASGEDHFAKFVIIPPRKAQPHLRRAIKDMKKIWKDIALADMGELIPAFRESTRKNRTKVNNLEKKLTNPN